MSIYGDAEAFFKTLCTLLSEVEEKNFDEFCKIFTFGLQQNLITW
jgi:hypothetical protein